MNQQNDSARTLARAAATPDLDALRTELAAVLSQAGLIRGRQNAAQNTRLCRWDGQSDDYRRHEEDLGRPAAPFEGAPDQRVPVVDMLTRERVALFVEALMAGEIQATPIGGLDQAEGAVKTSRVLRFLRENSLAGELRREAELLCNYQEGDEPGIGVLKICWKREPALEMRDLTLDDVGEKLLEARGIMLPQQGDPAAADGLPPQVIQLYQGAIEDTGDLIFNVTREEEAIETMALAFPTVAKRLLKKSLKELRRTQQTTLPLPYVKENRPCVTALRYMRDIFFPSDLDDIQKARAIFELERVSETELRARVHSDGYDENWVEAVIEAGPGAGEADGFRLDSAWTRENTISPRVGDAEADKLFEIWHGYTRASDAYGMPGIYWTVFSDKVDDETGYHDLLDYPDGEYPHVVFRAEIAARGVENTRGVAERAGSMQNDIKLQRDSRGAHTMLSTVPPVRVTQRRGGLEAVLGPMVEVSVRDEKDVTWMNPPQFPAASIEMEKAVWSDVNQYFGRIVPGMPTELAQVLMQNDVNRWLDTWKVVFGKILMLQQEFGDPVEMQLVSGGPMMTYAREEIRGRFSTFLAFSVRDLNIDFVMARNNAIASVLQQDITGIADRTPIIRAGLRAIDPNLVDQVMRDPQVVTQKEIADERQAVGMLANGIEAPLQQGGINAALRLDTLEKTVFGSRTLAMRYQQPQTPADEDFKELVDNRRKNLQFLVKQYGPGPDGNKAVGRQGTAPLQLNAGVATGRPN